MNTEHTNFPVVSEGRIGAVEIQTVNARDLHAFLKVGKDFSTWIKDRIEQYDFTQALDFEAFDGLSSPVSGSSKARAQATKEYAITLDMAKELSMVERNEQGKKARAYFIACERKAKQGVTAQDLIAHPQQLLAIAQGYALQIEDMKRDMVGMKLDVEALERIAKSDGSLCITDAAKALQVRPKELFDHLKAHGWIYRRLGSDHWIGYQVRVNAGELEHKVTTVQRADGSDKTTEQVRVTPQGLAKLAKAFPRTLLAV